MSGNVTVWDAFSRGCIGSLHLINSITENMQYTGILEMVMLSIPKTKCFMVGFFNNTMIQNTFQAPPRLVCRKSCTLKLCPQSPDVSAIEHP
jgi:hypothetical protein